MRIHRFYIEMPLPDSGIVLLETPDLVHQLKNVFRYMVGSQLVLFDGSGKECTAMVTSINSKKVEVEIFSCVQNKNTPETALTLFCAVSKKDTFEWIVQKGTELGVTRFVPLETRRGEKKKLNFDRLNKIAKEATEQSGRGIIPEIKDIISIEEALEKETMHFYAFDGEGEKFTLELFEGKDPVGIFIGPEGGWSDEEKALFKKEDVHLYSLGAGTLRTETAAIAVSALILLAH